MEEMTIKDVARICGVGVSTVSRAINNHPDINQETKEMIIETIRKYGYVPNNSARYLKKTEAKNIAVLVKGITNPFFNDMIKIIEEEIKKKKYSLIMHHVDFNENEVDVALELVKEKRLRGIIFLGGYFTHSEEKLSKLLVPFILSTVGGTPEMFDRKDYSSISVDDVRESYRVVDELIQMGHRKIAMISAGNEDESIGKLRYQGYVQALNKHKIPLNDKLVISMKQSNVSYSMENGYEATKELLATDEEFTALYAIADTLAIGACRAIYEAGKTVPGDYSVVGFDGIELGKYYCPSLSTLQQPIHEMAMATVNLLFDILADEEQHQHVVFEGTMILRESTRRQK